MLQQKKNIFRASKDPAGWRIEGALGTEEGKKKDLLTAHQVC